MTTNPQANRTGREITQAPEQVLFTPGEWESGVHPAIQNGWTVRPILFGPCVRVLPQCEGGHVLLPNKADADLIAAAKDMYAALEALLAEAISMRQALVADNRPTTYAEHEAIGDAQAALAKARGQ